MKNWIKEWKTELQAIGISLTVTVVFGIVFFLYILSINRPYSQWVNPGPIYQVCLSSVFLFVIVFLVVLLLLSRRQEKKNDE